MSSGAFPSREAQWSRKSRLEKPRGKRRNTKSALSNACTAASAKRKPLARCPSTSTGSLTPWNASSPSAILADPLDVQETSVGLKAYPP